MLSVIDYGMGNLKSIENALNYIGIKYKITDNIQDLKDSNGILLPGVGAFKDGMSNLRKNGLDEVIIDEALNGKPLLGICLGMQMLFNRGFEGEETEGLKLIDGEVKFLEMDNMVKVPHIGWNRLDIINDDHILKGLNTDSFVYYVHSYSAKNVKNENIICVSEYGGQEIVSLVRKDNIYGAQFHPEKSGEVGLEILRNFGEMIR